MRYFLDSNILIQFKNGPYAFDLVPAFWSWLDAEYSRGRIYSGMPVCRELLQGKDDLADWIKERRHSGMFVQPSEAAQLAYAEVADYVNKQEYPEHVVEHFLSGADPWVIAQAKADGACVVTMEKPVGLGSKRIKIPNVADALGVAREGAYEMMRTLGFKLTKF